MSGEKEKESEIDEIMVTIRPEEHRMKIEHELNEWEKSTDKEKYDFAKKAFYVTSARHGAIKQLRITLPKAKTKQERYEAHTKAALHAIADDLFYAYMLKRHNKKKGE